MGPFHRRKRDVKAEHWSDDPRAAVRDYGSALRSSPPAIVLEAHKEALREIDPSTLVALRSLLDAARPQPSTASDCSVEDVAEALGRLVSAGPGRALDALGQGEVIAGEIQRSPLTVLAFGFLGSQVWAKTDTEEYGGAGRTRDSAAESVAESAALRRSNTGGAGSPVT